MFTLMLIMCVSDCNSQKVDVFYNSLVECKKSGQKVLIQTQNQLKEANVKTIKVSYKCFKNQEIANVN
jgi:hypothetical protein